MFSQIIASLNLQKRIAKFAGPSAYGWVPAQPKKYGSLRSHIFFRTSRHASNTRQFYFEINISEEPSPEKPEGSSN